MLLVGVRGCEDIRGSTLHSLCMTILSRQHVLQVIGRIPRSLNRFEIEPLLYDLSNAFGAKRARKQRIHAYEAAWARLQHEEPGHAINAVRITTTSILRAKIVSITRDPCTADKTTQSVVGNGELRECIYQPEHMVATSQNWIAGQTAVMPATRYH